MTRIRFFGPLRDLTGASEEEVPGGNTVRDLLAGLASRHGEIFSPEDRPVPVPARLMLLVNGRHVQHLDGLDTRLSDGDELSVFPLLGGG